MENGKCNTSWSKCGLHFRKCIEQRNRIDMFGRGIIGCEPIKSSRQHDPNMCRTRTTEGTSSGTGDSWTRTTDSGGTGNSRTCTKREGSFSGTGDTKIKRRNTLLKPTFFQNTLLRWKLKRKAYFLVDDWRDGRPTKLGPILAGRVSFLSGHRRTALASRD